MHPSRLTLIVSTLDKDFKYFTVILQPLLTRLQLAQKAGTFSGELAISNSLTPRVGTTPKSPVRPREETWSLAWTR